MVNTNKIKGRMKELGLTQADVAKYLEVAQPTMNQKINNVRPFDLEEAEKLSRLLKIDAGDFGLYFFAPEVAYCNTNAADEAQPNPTA